MATIKSQMTLNDGMSKVLKKITATLDITLNSFEQVQRASGNAVDVGLIEQGRAALVSANREINQMSEYYRKAAQEEEKLNQGIDQGISAMDGMLQKVTSMAAAYMSLSKVKSWVTDSMSAADVQIGAQVQLKTVTSNMGTSDYYDQILEKASEIQSLGMYGDEAMIAGAGELATYFKDGKAILSMMDTLTNYAAGMSGGGAIDSTAMVEYATGIGKIMSGSYDAMTKKGFEFSDTQKAIIEGTATEQQIIAELGQEYVNLSNDMQAAAVIGNVIDEGWAGLYETMSNTPQGQVAQFNNALGDVQETVGAGIYPAVLNFMSVFRQNLPQIEGLAMGFVSVLGVVLGILTAIASGAISVGTAVADNWSWIEPLIWGVVTALIAYNAVQGIGWLTTMKDIAAKGAHAVASAAETAAILALIVAQDGLNAAMAACPITWIVVGIIALIAIFYAAVGAVNHFAGTSVSATGIIMGAFAVLGAFVLNHTVIPLYNGFAMFANFLGNVFNDPVAAVKVLFYDMALDVLGYVSNMAHAIENVVNKIPGVTVDITSGLDGFYKGLEAAQQAVKDESGWVEYVQKMDLIDYGNAASAGYNFGQGLENKIGGLFSYDLGSVNDYVGNYNTGLGYDLSGIADDTGNIADSTGGIADSLDVSTEELEYLRDIAERDAINRFTTAEVKIDMTGMTNKIDGGADLDGVIRELTDGFTEALLTAAEGVHA